MQDANTPPPLSAAAYATCVITAALWGGTAVAIQFSVDEIPPIFAAGLRFALAAAFMFVWCVFDSSQPSSTNRRPFNDEDTRTAEKTSRGPALWWCRIAISVDQWTYAWWAGVLLFLQIGLFHLGIARSSASHATVLINTYVLWVAAAEHFLLGTARLTQGRLIGLGLAAAGGLIIFVANAEPASAKQAGQDASSWLGDLLLFASAIALAAKVLYTKHAVQHVAPGPLILWHDVVGAVMFFIYSALWEEWIWLTPAWSTVLAILYQGLVVGGFCFGIQAFLLRKYGASQISIFSVATPLFGITFAHLFRGDPLSRWLWVSAASVVAGIVIVNRTGSQPKR